MFKYFFDKKPVVENAQRTNISVFIRHNYLQIQDRVKSIGKDPLDLSNETDVQTFIRILEEGVTLNLRQDNNGETSFSEPNKVHITYTKSNLSKGFVFWFVCNCCGRRVRYLYFPPNSEVLACRRCHRLAYKKQNENRPNLFRKIVGEYI